MNIGIIGGGALTEKTYLPILANNPAFGDVNVFLVEKNPTQLNLLKKKFHIHNVATDFRDVISEIDAAIVVLPNFLHAPIGLELLQNSVHVLIEKPIALTSLDAKKMIEKAKDKELVLSVGLVRRYLNSAIFIKRIIDSKSFGNVVNVHYSEGNPFRWPLKSPSLLSKVSAGGGILMDIGVHVLDLIQWWLGMPTSIKYSDDARGNMESECRIEMEFQDRAAALIELSRLRTMKNSIVIEFEDVICSFSTATKGTFEFISKKGELPVAFKGAPTSSNDLKSAFKTQIQDFIKAVKGNGAVIVNGEEGIKSLSIIEQCYNDRKLLIHY